MGWAGNGLYSWLKQQSSKKLGFLFFFAKLRLLFYVRTKIQLKTILVNLYEIKEKPPHQ